MPRRSAAEFGVGDQQTGEPELLVKRDAVVELGHPAFRFSPVTTSTSVFFDETNKQVFVVQENSPDITVKSLDPNRNETIRLGRGPVISIKHSLDYRILSIQRTSRTVVFLNRGPGLDKTEYSQSCKSKTSTHLLGFVWVGNAEVVFITNLGLEYYMVSPERRSLKLIKSYSLTVNWFVFSSENKVLLLSSSLQANVLQPYHFKDGTVTRLSKFEAELPFVYNQLSQKLIERDVYLAPIYQRLYCMIVKNNPKGYAGPKAEISLWKLSKDTTVKVATLALAANGRFAINTSDNLILVHHQSSKSTVVFDLKWMNTSASSSSSSTEGSEALSLHRPIIKPFAITMSKDAMATQANNGADYSTTDLSEYDLYSPSWIVFQPDIVIDAKLGALWCIGVSLNALVTIIEDKNELIDFLLRRAGSKKTILDVILRALEPATQVHLGVISRIFDQLNGVYARMLSQTLAGGLSDKIFTGFDAVLVQQSDMYKAVFLQLEDEPINYQFMVSVLIEYIRSLSQYAIPVEHFLYELVINLLVRHNRYYQLHQFLQYHVVNDSKHVACLLLSLENIYAPAFQLALDMLKRLATANEEILDVLVSKNQLLLALRFLRGLGQEAVATVSPRRFLEAAFNTDDASLFYIVYKFFEQRNINLRKTPDFRKGEDCEKYVQHYNRLFKN
eukprot:m.261353 g.261353  ORF g.261353 m.261353 type:complete len:673 (-) comp41979_c0_seq1:72-2090(-)